MVFDSVELKQEEYHELWIFFLIFLVFIVFF